jgi:hypothetical protein
VRSVLPLLALLAACATVSAAPLPLTGEWGGTHIGLQLTPSGGTLDYDCAHGTIGPVIVGPGGRFSAEGTHTAEHGGPDRQGEVLPSLHASYDGIVNGSRMTLTAHLDNGVQLGPFSLSKGAQPTLFRCL